MRKLEYEFDYTGLKYGRLTIIKELGMINKNRSVLAICECGNEKIFRLSHLRVGAAQSCGCLNREKMSILATTHGLSGHPLYDVHQGMKRRCYYKNDINYHNYGGRGIIVCDEWLNSFQSFYDWAINNGWKKNLQLDKDKLAPNQLGMIYSPEFCCFLTCKENLRYRRMTSMLEYKGEIKPFMEWCEVLKLSEKLIRSRIMDGWSVVEAFEKPIRQTKLIEYNNIKRTLPEWCNLLKVDPSAIGYRVNKLGWSYEKSFLTPMRKLRSNIYPQNNIK